MFIASKKDQGLVIVESSDFTDKQALGNLRFGTSAVSVGDIPCGGE